MAQRDIEVRARHLEELSSAAVASGAARIEGETIVFTDPEAYQKYEASRRHYEEVSKPRYETEYQRYEKRYGREYGWQERMPTVETEVGEPAHPLTAMGFEYPEGVGPRWRTVETWSGDVRGAFKGVPPKLFQLDVGRYATEYSGHIGTTIIGLGRTQQYGAVAEAIIPPEHVPTEMLETGRMMMRQRLASEEINLYLTTGETLRYKLRGIPLVGDFVGAGESLFTGVTGMRIGQPIEKGPGYAFAPRWWQEEHAPMPPSTPIPSAGELLFYSGLFVGAGKVVKIGAKGVGGMVERGVRYMAPTRLVQVEAGHYAMMTTGKVAVRAEWELFKTGMRGRWFGLTHPWVDPFKVKYKVGIVAGEEQIVFPKSKHFRIIKGEPMTMEQAMRAESEVLSRVYGVQPPSRITYTTKQFISLVTGRRRAVAAYIPKTKTLLLAPRVRVVPVGQQFYHEMGHHLLGRPEALADAFESAYTRQGIERIATLMKGGKWTGYTKVGYVGTSEFVPGPLTVVRGANLMFEPTARVITFDVFVKSPTVAHVMSGGRIITPTRAVGGVMGAKYEIFAKSIAKYSEAGRLLVQPSRIFFPVIPTIPIWTPTLVGGAVGARTSDALTSRRATQIVARNLPTMLMATLIKKIAVPRVGSMEFPIPAEASLETPAVVSRVAQRAAQAERVVTEAVTVQKYPYTPRERVTVEFPPFTLPDERRKRRKRPVLQVLGRRGRYYEYLNPVGALELEMPALKVALGEKRVKKKSGRRATSIIPHMSWPRSRRKKRRKRGRR